MSHVGSRRQRRTAPKPFLWTALIPKLLPVVPQPEWLWGNCRGPNKVPLKSQAYSGDRKFGHPR